MNYTVVTAVTTVLSTVCMQWATV